MPTEYSAKNSLFQQPYIDQDEWRQLPVKHRYVHGGFTGTDTKFSFYLPPKEQYQGRFFQYITPVPDSETLSQGATGEEDKISFAIDSGAYFIETNGGGQGAAAGPGSQADPTIGAYRANAAAAQYSRYIAQTMYASTRPYGYAFGGSGGAYRTIGGIENSEDVWDGVVPFVLGSPMALPNVFTARVYGMRVLADKLSDIADAVDVGSTVDPYATLNDEQREVLEEVSKMGFPLRAWHAYDHLGLHAFAIIYPAVVMADPSYFTDFWSKPGYAGYDPSPALKKDRIQHRTSVKTLIMADDAENMGLVIAPFAGQAHGRADDAWKAMQGQGSTQHAVAIELASVPTQNALGADLLVASGAANGSKLPMTRLQGNIVILGSDNADALSKIKQGDELLIDNSNFLAVQTYHRHQVPGKEYTAWDQFRDANGEPLYPQRPVLLGPLFAQGASGSIQTGKFKGKMILLENLYDTEAFAWQGDWYRQRVIEHLGENTDDNFRLWFTDHTNHGDFTHQAAPTHTVSYLGTLQQALRDLSDWVERDIAPPPTSQYEVIDGQVIVPPTANARRGIQPVVSVRANGKLRAEVTAGTTVTLTGTIEVPPNTGTLVSAEWDFNGEGEYPLKTELNKADTNNVELHNNTVTVTTTYQFKKPGTYFPVLRVASQRQSNSATPFARVQNLGRVRVVVE